MDLNCDMGELKAGQVRNYDAEIMPFISSCNVACGFHSGSPLLMEKTIKSALQHQVAVGAHPSYNDRENFGRLSLKVKPEVLAAELRYQIAAVKGMTESMGGRLTHVKPHGALYNDMVKDKDLAKLVIDVVKSIDPELKIFVLAQSQINALCRAAGMRAVQEGFADRRYQVVTELRSRKLPGAVIEKETEVLRQVGNFLENRVTLYDGTVKEIKIESICLHSDTAGAVNLSRKIYEYLIANEIDIRPTA